MAGEEQPGKVSSLEERFERWRRRLGLALGPLAALALYAAASGLPAAEQWLAAVLVFFSLVGLERP